MGYDLDRFLAEPDPELICSICRKVLENPRVTPCGHTFCLLCIEKWLDKRCICPRDGWPLGPEDLREVSIPFKKLMAKFLHISCIYRVNGCRQVNRLESLERHQRECPFREKRPPPRRPRPQDMHQRPAQDVSMVRVFVEAAVITGAIYGIFKLLRGDRSDRKP